MKDPEHMPPCGAMHTTPIVIIVVIIMIVAAVIFH